AAVPGNARVRAAEVTAVGRAGRAVRRARSAHALALVRADRSVADGRRAVEGVAGALRVAGAGPAHERRADTAEAAGVPAAAVVADGVAVTDLAVALVADVAGAVAPVAGALTVGAAAAAGVGGRDAADLAGGAVIRRVVAVAIDTGVRQADGAGAVLRVVPAGGVRSAAAAAGVRGRDAADLTVHTVDRGVVAVARHALGIAARAQADVHRAVG